MLSFNSYGEWTELPASNPEEQGFIDFDNLQERSDGYVYWWMMTSYSNRSEKFYIQTDCQAGRIKPLQEDYHNEPMGGGDLTSSTESEIGWYYPAPDTGIYRFVEVACEMAKEIPEERWRSVANLLMELEYKNKINKLSEEAEEARTQEAEILAKEATALVKEAELKQSALEAKTKEAELLIEEIYKQLTTAYVNNIAARVKTFWRYQAAEDDWTCEVYVIQDRQGQVNAVDVRNCNVGNSSIAKSFRDSIERAVYKASPLPSAPDEAVFDSEIYMVFRVN